MWKNVRQATDDNIIRGVFCACWISKTTKTHPEYVILIAFPRQQWLNKRSSILRHTHIVCLLVYLFLLPRKGNLSDCVYTGELSRNSWLKSTAGGEGNLFVIVIVYQTPRIPSCCLRGEKVLFIGWVQEKQDVAPCQEFHKKLISFSHVSN
jgi:hypothetical protein